MEHVGEMIEEKDENSGVKSENSGVKTKEVVPDSPTKISQVLSQTEAYVWFEKRATLFIHITTHTRSSSQHTHKVIINVFTLFSITTVQIESNIQ